jgi:DNA phosphorothioation-dependent restriction protein DptH
VSKFVETLADYIRGELANAVGAELGYSLRVIFSGPPPATLAAVFEHLTGGSRPIQLETPLGRLSVPVYLLDRDAQDPETVPHAARCTDNYFVMIRNNVTIGVCLALHDCVSTTNSVDSTVTRLGIPHELRELDDWMNASLVRKLIDGALEHLVGAGGVEKARPAVAHALAEAWEIDDRHRDKRTSWQVLERLFMSGSPQLEPHLAVSLALGLPSCEEAELGSKDHLDTLSRLAGYLESHGLRPGLASIEETAGPDLREHVRAFRQHLDELGLLDTAEIVAGPLQVYHPFGTTPGVVPEWWRALTVENWSRLLDVGSDPTPEGKLEVIPIDTLVTASRGMPNIVRDAVAFEITARDTETSIDVVISRASGTAQPREVGRFSIAPDTTEKFVDEEVPKHERFVRYKIESDGYSAVNVKFIALEHYGPGIVALAPNSQKCRPFSINKKAKDDKGRTIFRYECDLELTGMGLHHLDLYVATSVELPAKIQGFEIDAEHTEVDFKINRYDENHAVCLIETDEECYFDFSAQLGGSADGQPYRIHVTALDMPPTGASSEFDRLVVSNRAAARREHVNARVDPVSCRAANLEEWIVDEPDHSYRPLILGPDYLDTWCKPDWNANPVISARELPIDPRPERDTGTAPDEFLAARRRLFDFFKNTEDGRSPVASTIKYWEHMRDEAFRSALSELLSAYEAWLESDFESAAWTDTVAVHAAQATAGVLESAPYAVLLSPFHPVRLAWQCRAQEVLQLALDKERKGCPAASMLNPSAFPDCMVLPCRTATGSVDRRPFVAITSSSDYWSVLWSTTAVDRLAETDRRNEVLGTELGIEVDGLASGFSAQQVIRSLDEVSRLVAGRSTIRVGISSDSAGSGSCNDGIDGWCLSQLGDEQDAWATGGARSLRVTDYREPALQPEQSLIASLTARTSSTVSWFSGDIDSPGNAHDLSIVAHLGTMNQSFSREGIRSAIDPTGLTRWRVRKQLASQNKDFIAESRIGEIPTMVDRGSISGKLLSCVDIIEQRCRDHFDCYVFAPNMGVLDKVVSHSSYTAVSSSNIDAACFFGPTSKAYMWDYELPAYSRRAGENSGYYLLARESEGMLRAVRSALSMLGDPSGVPNESISSMLEEISRRGMPTLKRLTAGGSMSLGEIGMLVALRLLQSDFEPESDRPALLPVRESGQALSFVVPADPFKNQFEDLRVALEKRQGERPDLLVLSLGFQAGEPKTLRITPVEVKARRDTLSAPDRKAALDQAHLFGKFLDRLSKQAGESELWSVAWNSLVATLLDYAFRVYGQLDHFMQQSEWAIQHSAALRSLTNGGLSVEIDTKGRLIVIDGTNSSGPADTDRDSFNETIVLSHADALSLLVGNGEAVVNGVRSHLLDWNLKPREVTIEVVTLGAETDPVPAPQSESSTKGSGHTALGSAPDAASKSEPEEYKPDSTAAESKSASTLSSGGGNEDPNTTRIGVNTSAEAASSASDGTSGSIQGIRFPIGRTIKGFIEEDVHFFPGNTALNQLNVGIVGDLGTGKTQLIKSLIYQLQANPGMNRGKRPNILIFDYKKDYTKPDFVEATGAKVIEPFDIPLNLFDIRDSQQQRNAWLERSKFFSDILDKIYSGIGPAQREKIKQAVKASYEAASSFGGRCPTLNDVFDQYKQIGGGTLDSPYSIMSDLVDGEYFVSDASKVVPFSEFLDGVVVLDLAKVGQDDRTKNTLVVVFLNLFYEHMLRIQKKPFIGTDPQLRAIDSLLLVDEADNIMQYEFDILMKLLLQGREFGVGVLLASQYLSHFKTKHENYAEPLLTWFVHKVPKITARDLESIGLSDIGNDTIGEIKSLKPHQCFVKTLGVDGKLVRGIPFFEIMPSIDR